MIVCPHRNAFTAVFNTSVEVVSVREYYVVDSVRTVVELCNTSDGCTAPEHNEEEVPSYLAQIASHVSRYAENVLPKDLCSILKIIYSD